MNALAEQRIVAGVPIHYAGAHWRTAEAMAEAVEKTVALLSERWRLAVPTACRLFVLSDWHELIDRTAPSLWRPLIRLTRALWRKRVDRAMAMAGGITIPWRSRPVVAVKPAEALGPEPHGLGARLFVPVEDPLERVRHITCHELTHASTAHRRLPTWLNEGIAMRAVDHLVGHPTVLDTSRALAKQDPALLDERAYRRLEAEDEDLLLELYATGYWTTRRLDERDPEQLLALLSSRGKTPKLPDRR